MASYDPSKTYSWLNEEKFEISGREFNLFMRSIHSILSTEQAAQVLLADKAAAVIERIMTEYVEKGIIKEVEER